MSHNPLTALSPLDGRYASNVSAVAEHFSELALIKGRLEIEIKYLRFLSEKKLIPAFSEKEEQELVNLCESFYYDDAEKIKIIEQKISHDMKAVEYFLREWMREKNISKGEYIHLALTSEDVNNLVYSLNLQTTVTSVLIPKLVVLIETLGNLAEQWAHIPMLARTHGQPAIPTTMGKELIVFAVRLAKAVDSLSAVKLEGKLTGAVGTLAAHQVAFPHANWPELSEEFVRSLGLQPVLLTTQILPTESYVRIFQSLQLINGILLDLNQDLWRYISDGWLVQKVTENEVGSSTMPQKVNPIDFENSEGNLGLANALLQHLCEKLPISRLQRDLSDSTVKRSIGTALGHCLLAYQSCLRGLNKISVNEKVLRAELENHWEIVTEGLQTVLRIHGDERAYEKLKELSRGKAVTRESVSQWIDSLEGSDEFKSQLRAITPTSYVGLAKKLVAIGIQEIEQKGSE